MALHTTCDGVKRRDFLKVGVLGTTGLGLSSYLRLASAGAVQTGQATSAIFVNLPGGPSHMDTFDLKPNAPEEYRGLFNPIQTNVEGIEICELLPRMAKVMDKLIPIRSVVGSPNGAHDSYICYTGRKKPNEARGGWPSGGSCVSSLLGPTEAAIPLVVGLSPNAGHPPYGSPVLPGFLGQLHSAFRPNGSR